MAFYIAPGPVEPAWLVRQGAEELLAGTAWGRKPSYCKLLLFLTCNSLPRWGDALGHMFGGAEGCAARTAREEWHAAMEGTMGIGRPWGAACPQYTGCRRHGGGVCPAATPWQGGQSPELP